VALFAISIFENSMIILAYNSVQYVMNDVNNCCCVNLFIIKSIILIFVILYYVSIVIYQKLTINNEGDSN